jgi:hypothetical protein
MKRKFAIVNLALMAVVQLTIAWQSFHAFSHEHSHAVPQKKESKQFSNNYSHEEDCSICDFHFDYFIAPQEFCCRLDFLFKPIPYSFSSIEGSAAFAGSLYAHRGPPVV